jgi:hypothetical protein
MGAQHSMKYMIHYITMQLTHTQQHNSKEKVPDATMNEIEVR